MQELFDLFEEFGYPYYRQGSLSSTDYPDEAFFTFWNYDTPILRYRDNDSKDYSINVMVYFYTNNAFLIYDVMSNFIIQAKKKGFIVEGKAYDTPSDREDYFGRLVSIKIIRKED